LIFCRETKPIEGGDKMLLEHVQIIKEHDQPKFAVIDFDEYTFLKDLLVDEEKLQDYLDFLHIQHVKGQTQQIFTLDDVKKEVFG
jgi:hypothetical protein